MQSRILLSATLATGIIILAWYLAKSATPPSGQAITVAASLDPASVQRIQISRADKEDIVIEKSGNDWIINSPLSIAANPFRINSILSLPSSRSLAQLPANESDLDQLGLQPSAVTLRLDDNVFEFGTVSPLEEGRYLLHGQTIHVIEDNLFHQLVQDTGFFISTRLISDDDPLVRISYPDFELHYTDDRWHQSGGVRQLSPAELDIITSTWSGLEANRVSLASADNRETDILLHTASGVEIALSVQSSATGLVLSRTAPRLDYRISRETGQALGLDSPGDE